MELTMLVSLGALGLSVVLFGFILKILFDKRALKGFVETQEDVVNSLKQSITLFSNETHEIRSGTLAMVGRLKQLELQVEELKNAQQSIVEQDPQSRFYAKGVRLISQGASVDEVVRECEMPLAEAELLFNLHNK